MYTETAYQKKIIAAKKDVRLRCIIRCSFAVVIFGWVFVNCINLGFAQTEDTTVEGISKNNNVRKINVQKPQPEAKYHIVYHTKNLVPLPFNNPRFKPIYTGRISPEDSEKTRKAMTMMLEKSKSSNPLTKMMSSSKFYLKEQKQKDREKHKREIQVYNERNNKKFNEYFKRLQQKRSHSANYSGRHFDYTSYNQNIQVAASR